LVILIFLLIFIRQRLGKDWKSVAKTLGYGKAGGQFAVKDDGNPIWEDIEYESDDEYEFECMWRADEEFNNEGKVEIKPADKDLESERANTQMQIVKVFSLRFDYNEYYTNFYRQLLILSSSIGKANGVVVRSLSFERFENWNLVVLLAWIEPINAILAVMGNFKNAPLFY
jgi:hypothetical protein